MILYTHISDGTVRIVELIGAVITHSPQPSLIYLLSARGSRTITQSTNTSDQPLPLHQQLPGDVRIVVLSIIRVSYIR